MVHLCRASELAEPLVICQSNQTETRLIMNTEITHYNLQRVVYGNKVCTPIK